MRLFKSILFVLFIWALPVIVATGEWGFGGFWNKEPKAEEE